MWDNLLSGTIGSIIGVAGAVLVAFVTMERTRRHEMAQAQREREIAISGPLAFNLVAIYDELKAIDLRGEPPDPEDLDRLLPLARDAMRWIVVDGPAMPPAVAAELKEARKAMAALVTARGELNLDEVGRARAAVHTAAEKLRRLRGRDNTIVDGATSTS